MSSDLLPIFCTFNIHKELKYLISTVQFRHSNRKTVFHVKQVFSHLYRLYLFRPSQLTCRVDLLIIIFLSVGLLP